MYYYKTISSVCFEGDSKRYDKDEGMRLLTELRRKGYQFDRLYLDSPIDYIVIRNKFFTPAYWAGRTWQEEDLI